MLVHRDADWQRPEPRMSLRAPAWRRPSTRAPCGRSCRSPRGHTPSYRRAASRSWRRRASTRWVSSRAHPRSAWPDGRGSAAGAIWRGSPRCSSRFGISAGASSSVMPRGRCGTAPRSTRCSGGAAGVRGCGRSGGTSCATPSARISPCAASAAPRSRSWPATPASPRPSGTCTCPRRHTKTAITALDARPRGNQVATTGPSDREVVASSRSKVRKRTGIEPAGRPLPRGPIGFEDRAEHQLRTRFRR